MKSELFRGFVLCAYRKIRKVALDFPLIAILLFFAAIGVTGLFVIDPKNAFQTLSAGTLALATASIAYMSATTTQERNARIASEKQSNEARALIDTHAIWIHIAAWQVEKDFSALFYAIQEKARNIDQVQEIGNTLKNSIDAAKRTIEQAKAALEKIESEDAIKLHKICAHLHVILNAIILALVTDVLAVDIRKGIYRPMELGEALSNITAKVREMSPAHAIDKILEHITANKEQDQTH